MNGKCPHLEFCFTPAPQGRKEIAHRFNGGYEREARKKSRQGRKKNLPSLPGLFRLLTHNPPLKRWAILCRPCGIGIL